MDIELKTIRYYEERSRKSYAFSANLYINGVMAGVTGNNGQGGHTTIKASGERGETLITLAEIHCRQMPAIEKASPVPGGAGLRMDMDLKVYIESLIDKHLMEQKAAQREAQELKAEMGRNFVIGTSSLEPFRKVNIKIPMDSLLASLDGKELLVLFMKNYVLPELKPGEVILNTNIPEEIFRRVELKDDQYIKSKSIETKRSRKINRRL